jgi:hypothetical protein
MTSPATRSAMRRGITSNPTIVERALAGSRDVAKFASSFEAALHVIAAKRSRLGDPEPSSSALPGAP